MVVAGSSLLLQTPKSLADSLALEVRTGHEVFGGDRESVRRQTVMHALRGVLDAVGA